MGSLDKNRGGIGATGMLAVFLTLVVVGAASWLVYQNNKTKPTSAETGNQSSSRQPSSNTKNQSAVDIPELGIQITVPGDIKDLTYETSSVTLKNGNKAILAMFSTKALSAIDSKCDSSAMPLGSLGKANGTYPTASQDETNVLDYGQLVKQFPGFYIASGSPQAGCSTNGNALNAMSKFKQEFQAAEPTIQQLSQ